MTEDYSTTVPGDSGNATLSPDVKRLQSDRTWYGYLTVENLDAVVDRIRGMIGEGQPYTWIAVNDALYRPEVRTSQRAYPDIKVHRSKLSDGSTHGHFNVRDTYGVWGLGTTVPDQHAAYEVPEADRKSLTFLNITHEEIEIEHFAPAGHRLVWVIALEDRSTLEDLAAVEGERDNAALLAAGRGEAIQRVRDLHPPAEVLDENDVVCGYVCGGCLDGFGKQTIAWPCSNIVALDGEPESEATS